MENWNIYSSVKIVIDLHTSNEGSFVRGCTSASVWVPAKQYH